MRRLWSGLLVAGVLLAGLVMGVWAQAEDGVLARVEPLLVRVQQQVPVSVTLGIPLASGEMQTVTAPAVVTVDVSVEIADKAVVTAEPVDGVGSVQFYDIEPSEYTLRLEDMPPGFILNDSYPAGTNEGVASQYGNTDEVLAQLETWGRRGGHYTRFVRSGLDALFGNAVIQSGIIVMEEAEGAGQYFDFIVEQRRSGRDEYVAFHEVSVSQIADEVVAFRMDEGEGEEERTRYQIEARKGNLLVSVRAGAVRNGGSFQEAFNLLQAMVDKIDAAR